jgi:Eukaryotic initiation factor 4E
MSSLKKNDEEKEHPEKDAVADSVVIEEKHFLQNPWKFTYKPKAINTKKQPSESDWLQSFKLIHPSIKSIEMFWSVKNNIIEWSKLHHGSTYAFFKNNINPSWEDDMNREGCSYMFYFNQNRITEQDLDDVFESALLFLIGEWSIYSQFINGITFERKMRGDKMIVWCNSHSKEMLIDVKNELLPENVKEQTSLQSGELNDNRFKVSIKVIDHKSELQRIHGHK